MPTKCFVPGCRSNYNASSKVRVFGFPKDEELKRLWLQAINREDKREPSKSSKVCGNHFKPEDIITVSEGFDSKSQEIIQIPLQKYRLAKDAVPSVFINLYPVRKRRPTQTTDLTENTAEEGGNPQGSEADTSNMQIKDVRSISTSEASKASDDEEESMDSAESDKEGGSPTTDRPFISLIKPNDEPSTAEEGFEDSMSSPIKQSPNSKSSRVNSISRPRNVSSPYKHQPSAAGNLDDEDTPKEVFKSSKRSLPSNYNSGEASRVQPKRKKVEKPAPTVIGKQNDCYCWVCHRENVVLSCIACPRAYHIKCANENGSLADWVCPECKRTLTAEDVDTRSSVLSEISLDKLCTLLRFSLNKMKHRAGVAFHQPVSLEHYPMYLHYVIHPMDFSLLEKNIKQKLYGCTEAFLSDVKWILHNSCVFNGSQHPLSTNAKSMVKACDNDMQEIEVCPDCFMHNIVRNKYWFSEVCQKPHPLVWAKLKGFPYWPAKVVRIADGNVDARFFGAHDRAWVPISQCYHLSKEMPTSSKPKKKGNYETALDELSVHVQLLIQKYGTFEYAPYRTTFDPEDKHMMYHGINLDLINKQEAQNDIPSSAVIELAAMNKEEESSISKENDESKDSDLPKTDSESNLVTKASDDSTPSLMSSTKGLEDKPKPETSQTSKKDSSPLSERKKIELALQRIQGYISNDIEEEHKEEVKETEKDFEREKVSNKETDSNSVETSSSFVETLTKYSDMEDKEENMCLSDLVKSKAVPPPVSLPIIDDPPIEDAPEKDPVLVMGDVKKDSFALKLIETIASCKAKLGISGDLDKSDSHESDSEEEDSEEEEEEDGEKSDSKHSKALNKATSDASSTEEEASDESSSESDAESVSSNTDIEMVEEDTAEKETEKVIEPQAASESSKCPAVEENPLKDIEFESNAASTNVSVSGETHSPKKSNDVSNENLPDTELVQDNEKSNSLETEKETFAQPSPAVRSRSVSSNALQSSTDDLTDTDIQLDGIEHQQPVPLPDQSQPKTDDQPVEDTNEIDDAEMVDDDIYICPPVKPPTPPLICLDDGTETEPEPEENTESVPVKLPPPEKKICPENTAKYVSILKNAKLIPQNARKSSVKRPMRDESSEEESSDDEYAASTPPKKVPLSGAIRTFNNRGTLPAQQVQPRPEASYSGILAQNEAGARNDVNQARGILDISDDCAQNIEVRTEPDVVSELAAKNAEIMKLKKKLSCIFSAFQLQQWKSTQEKAELRHNMNLIVMEMRASLESDKKQTIESLTKTLEREKERCIEETKKKQWCAFCYQESRYACCWNTSYCTVACQKRHFPDHRNVCTQLKLKPNDPLVPTTSVSEEGKKVLVVNVIPRKDAKSIGDDNSGKPQFALPNVVSPKQSLHLVSTSSPTTNSPIQYVLTTTPNLVGSPASSLSITSSKADTPDIERAEDKPATTTSQDQASTSNKKPEKEELSLEEFYFPSPPTICFEGLDTALPDETVNFDNISEETPENRSSDSELTIAEESSAEEDLIMSDNDEADNEMVDIGRGIEVKAKYLNKCLIYGKDAKKLTRCLVDVLFSGSILAMCSAFGNKSNVTKLTRAALPHNKVVTIIDFVQKRFPKATRSEIVLVINMKCKEARVLAEKTNNSNKNKMAFRRLLAKEQKEDETEEHQIVDPADTKKDLKDSTTPSTSKTQTVTVFRQSVPSIVNLKALPNIHPPNVPTKPNILRMSRQILIRPKQAIPPTSRMMLTPTSTMQFRNIQPTFRNTKPTVKNLLNMQKALDGTLKNQVMVPVGLLNKAVIGNPGAKSDDSSTSSPRPLLIIGAPSPLPAVSTQQPSPVIKNK